MAGVLASGGVTSAASAPPATAASVATATIPAPAPSEAADAATAVALAARYRSPVEVLGERTESAQTFAQPDGTFRLRQSASPQRVRRGTAWVPVDTTLKMAGGVAKPVATTLPIRFSGGGSAPMVSVGGAGRMLSLKWQTTLPVPTLAGDTATYAEVLPGVDLKLTAAVDSFSEVLVVKTAQAAKNPKLARLPFRLATSGVTLQQDADTGFLRAVNATGAAVFVSDGARMWDSPEPEHAQFAARSAVQAVDEGADPVPSRTEDVAVQLSGQELTLLPSSDLLLHPDTNFPVFIDPGFNGGTEIWTPVSRKNPNTSYWTSTSYRDYMRVGQGWQSSSDDDWRTLVKFYISPLQGTQIIKASVHAVVWHSANCVPSPLQLWRTSAISKSSAVTWNSTKGKTWTRLAEVQATANKHSCPKGNDEVKFDQKAVKDVFQDVATKKSTTITFAFRAKSETDDLQWKKLVAGSTYLDINYNRIPGKPGGLGVSPCNKACSSPTSTSSSKPMLRMTATDGDGGKLLYQYRVYAADKTTLKVDSGTLVGGVASGSARGWTVTKVLADGRYFWRGRACDSYICGANSDWHEIVVDAKNPLVPNVKSTDYPPPEAWSGAPGKSGDFTFTPGTGADGVSGYVYALNGGLTTQVTPNGAGVSTVSVKPTRERENVLTVSALDRAGNRSDPREYRFLVLPVDSRWYWSLDEGTGTTAKTQPDNSGPATISGSGVTWADAGKDSSSGSASFASLGEFTTAHPVLKTTQASGFTVAAWVRLPAPDADDTPVEDPGTPGDGEEDPPGAGDDPDSEESPPNTPDTSPVLAVPGNNQTAVSEDGTTRSMFRLGYRNDLDVDQAVDEAGMKSPDPAWCFSVAAADIATAAETTACTTQYVAPGDWTHLVGEVDPIKGQIRLYVNGTEAYGGAVVAVAGKALWEATGAFAIGRARTAGAVSERWNGDIDEVYAAPKVWGETDIEDKAHPLDEQ